MAELGVQLAHVDGGVPNIRIEIPEISESVIGGLLYFLREGLRHQRLYAGRESLRPAGRRGLQEEHVRPCWTNPGYEEASKAIKARL